MYSTGNTAELESAFQNDSIKTVSTGGNTYTHDVDRGTYVSSNGNSEFTYKEMANKIKQKAIKGHDDFKVTN